MDISQLQAAIGLATGAVGLTGQAASTVETIKGLLTKSGGKPDDDTNAVLNNLATQLTSANMMNVQLSEALKELSRQAQRDDEFERERARYEVFHTSVDDIVLRLRKDATNGERERFICPVCANTKQIISFVTGDRYYKNCQTCRHVFQFERQPMRDHSSDDGW